MIHCELESGQLVFQLDGLAALLWKVAVTVPWNSIYQALQIHAGHRPTPIPGLRNL